MDELLRPEVIQPKGVVQAPAGFADHITRTIEKKDVDMDDLKSRKAWEVAIGPAKSIPMNLIMSYMTGNSLQMIPIMMTLMLLLNPIKAIFNDTNRVFRNLETESNHFDIIQAKVIFVVCQIGCMSIGVWKLNKMGLIPNSEGDWLSFKAWEHSKEVLVRL